MSQEKRDQLIKIIEHYFLLDKAVTLKIQYPRSAYRLKDSLQKVCQELIDDNPFDPPISADGKVLIKKVGECTYNYSWGVKQSTTFWEIVTDDIEVQSDLGSIEDSPEIESEVSASPTSQTEESNF